ncbi:hypothetical protein ASF49_08300 [Methylobacterium sp. Leaf104]|uniref:hypothetical protein n=1 Tax=Methylobacterium TaxID=407 RepID=UPI000700539B|nr:MULTISPECIES: hypothetical protein [Methylobacterium]KQP33857.1 hypothetical protein ASF49_08300 [Methylobacterium sp. Leaf104]MCI9879572.1 hypothetical protein [Methylobacterium goesingense]
MTDRMKAAADAALARLHTFPIERRVTQADLRTIQTDGSLMLGRESFETEEEWREFTRSLGVGNVPPNFRISLTPQGEHRLCDDSDFDTIEISGSVTYLG